MGPYLPLKCLNVTWSRLFRWGRLEHRDNVEAIRLSKVRKGHVKRCNITPWEVGEEASYFTISAAQLFLIGRCALLIVRLGCRIKLCKDLSNKLDHTDGIRYGQPVMWI